VSYVVAIPSYQRPAALFEHSIATLASKQVPLDKVHVFLHDNDPHLDEYLLKLDLLGANAVVTQARGIGEQRTAITNHFPAGAQVVGMDDDIQGVMSTTGPRWAHAYQVDNLDALFTHMFAHIQEEGLKVWGLAPVDNPFFLKPGQISHGLKLVMFTMFGFINRPGHPVHHGTVRYKDEQEFSLRAWWYDGGAARNDGVAVKTTFYSDGGCQAAGRDYAQVDESVESLLVQWPGLIKRAPKRKSDWPEVALARRGRHAGNPEHALPPGAQLLQELL
jgi:hypothetical protein